MHLKVFLKLKKTLKTLSSGQIYLKKPKKKPKNPKKHWAGFKKKSGFFQPCKVGFIPATESRRPDVVKAVAENAVIGDVLRYVDNLLLHDGDDLDCEHHEVIWEGAGELVMPSRSMHDELPEGCEFRLVACSSIDQHSRDTEAWDQIKISIKQCCGSMTFWGGSGSGSGSADSCF